MFSGIAHKVPFLYPMMKDFFPFKSGWKPGSPPAPQVSLLELGNDAIRVIVSETLLPSLIATVVKIRLNFPGFSLVWKQEPWIHSIHERVFEFEIFTVQVKEYDVLQSTIRGLPQSRQGTEESKTIIFSTS
jgi:hypothetical protein